jgi:4-hydroxy-tetrahydrodipicolinate synthase
MGSVPCGTTGEGQFLQCCPTYCDHQHRVQHRGSLGIIAGTGCQSLDDTITFTKPPLPLAPMRLSSAASFYKRSGEAGVIARYRQLCDALPLGAKSSFPHPSHDRRRNDPAIIDALLHSNPAYIYGIKDSGVNAAHTAMLVATYPTLKIYTGNAPILAQAIADGAAGSILAIANIVPQALRQLTDDPSRDNIQAQVASVDGYVRKVAGRSHD